MTRPGAWSHVRGGGGGGARASAGARSGGDWGQGGGGWWRCGRGGGPGGIFSITIASSEGQEFPNLGCFLDVVPMERLVWTSMLFPDYRPAVFDDIPITAIVSMETVGTGTRYVFTALHRDEADFEKNKTSGFLQGTEIALDQFVAHVKSMLVSSA